MIATRRKQKCLSAGRDKMLRTWLCVWWVWTSTMKWLSPYPAPLFPWSISILALRHHRVHLLVQGTLTARHVHRLSYIDVHECSWMFYDVHMIFLLLWRVDSTSLKGGLTSTASALPGAKQSSIKTAKPHSTIKLAKGDKRETNSALLRLARCSEPENMLFARTCYLAAHRHATLARHIRPRKWSTRYWHMLAHKSVLCSLLRLKLQKRCHLHCQNALGI